MQYFFDTKPAIRPSLAFVIYAVPAQLTDAAAFRQAFSRFSPRSNLSRRVRSHKDFIKSALFSGGSGTSQIGSQARPNEPLNSLLRNISRMALWRHVFY